jgi:ribonuclease BN (tRNA processing enzyme)
VKITALGSADAFFSEGRGHTCWLLEDERGACAVDFGATALQALKRLGRDPSALQAVHFTHLHGDHIAGWPFLMVDAVYRLKRTAPLSVSGPPGTRERLHALWSACYARAATLPLPFPLEVRELRPGESAAVAGREVRAFAAQHMTPPEIALSLRIGDVAFTGDTGAIAPGLCDGAKLLCAECTDLQASSPGPQTSARHLSWSQLRHVLPQVPRVVLAHLGEEARRGIPRDAGVLVCDDLDFFEL